MSEDGIRIRDVLAGLSSAVVVEDYPTFGKGPAVLALQSDSEGRPLHIVWGIPKGLPGPAVLITDSRGGENEYETTGKAYSRRALCR